MHNLFKRKYIYTEHIAPLHTTWSFIPQASKALPKEGQEAEVLGDKNWRPFRACLKGQFEAKLRRLGKLTWNQIMEVWFRCFFFSFGWF